MPPQMWVEPEFLEIAISEFDIMLFCKGYFVREGIEMLEQSKKLAKGLPKPAT